MRPLGVLIKLFMPCTVGALRVDEDGSDVVQIHICLTYTASAAAHNMSVLNILQGEMKLFDLNMIKFFINFPLLMAFYW